MDIRRIIAAALAAGWLGAGCTRFEERDRYAARATYHIVHRGETLSTIARRYGTSPEQLARDNRIANPNFIRIGQRLRVPAGAPGAGLRKTTVSRADLPQGSGPARGTGRFGWPLRGTVIRRYGGSVDGLPSRGIAIAGARGEPVLAADGGRVVLASDQMRGYGKVVVVDHGRGYTTVYAHNEELLVRRGESVRAGQAIARVGSTGRASRPQLGFRLYHHGEPRDPLRHLR